jgi:hypothetical protein
MLMFYDYDYAELFNIFIPRKQTKQSSESIQKL